MRLAATIVAGFIAIQLPGAYGHGPLWWAILGSVLLAANIVIALTSTTVKR